MSKRIKKMQDERYGLYFIHVFSLSEYQLREINDEINHLHRRRTNYEKQIIRLGGLDYSKNKVFDDEGKEVPGGNGYRYYGLAKDIPGIRELLVPVKRKRRVVKKSLKEIQQRLDLDYFGFHSAEREKELLKLEEEASRVYKEKIKQSLGTPNDNSENSDSEVTDYEDMIDFDALEKEESERRILEEKKRQLVEKYCKLK